MILMQIGQLEKYGNMKDLCPLPKGVYAIRNFGMDEFGDDDKSHEAEPGQYRIDMIMWHTVEGVRSQLLKKALYASYSK